MLQVDPITSKKVRKEISWTEHNTIKFMPQSKSIILAFIETNKPVIIQDCDILDQGQGLYCPDKGMHCPKQCL